MKLIILIVAASALVSATPTKYNLTQIPYRNLNKNLYNVAKSKVEIINGHEVAAHSIPYQALLETYTKNQEWVCSGSLISSNYVLTTGSCVDGESAVVYVTLGVHNILKTETTRLRLVVNSFIFHPNYFKDSLEYNIALIKLPETVPKTSTIQPVKLPKRSDTSNTYAGSIARISGWGFFSLNNPELSDVLRYADVEVMTNDECARTINGGSWIKSERILCTSGQSSTGACDSDSGDPLVIDGVQIGVQSFILSECPLGAPSGYARITAFLDWIQDNSDVYIE